LCTARRAPAIAVAVTVRVDVGVSISIDIGVAVSRATVAGLPSVAAAVANLGASEPARTKTLLGFTCRTNTIVVATRDEQKEDGQEHGFYGSLHRWLPSLTIGILDSWVESVVDRFDALSVGIDIL